jgi:hypothetical protein
MFIPIRVIEGPQWVCESIISITILELTVTKLKDKKYREMI